MQCAYYFTPSGGLGELHSFPTRRSSDLAAGATFDDQSTTGGTFTIQSTAGTAGAVTNLGTWQNSGAAATSAVNVAFNNSGTIDVKSGTLLLNGAVSNTGTLHADGGTLTVSTAVSDA